MSDNYPSGMGNLYTKAEEAYLSWLEDDKERVLVEFLAEHEGWGPIKEWHEWQYAKWDKYLYQAYQEGS